jgi:hypothetical protein
LGEALASGTAYSLENGALIPDCKYHCFYTTLEACAKHQFAPKSSLGHPKPKSEPVGLPQACRTPASRGQKASESQKKLSACLAHLRFRAADDFPEFYVPKCPSMPQGSPARRLRRSCRSPSPLSSRIATFETCPRKIRYKITQVFKFTVYTMHFSVHIAQM